MWALKEMGVLLVCAAGNSALDLNARGVPRTSVDTFPAVYSSVGPFHALLVVGNCDNDGKRYPTSQKMTVSRQMYAPGVGIHCASATSQSAYNVDTGTSFCKCIEFHLL